MTSYIYQITLSEPTRTRTLIKSSPIRLTHRAIGLEFGGAGVVVLDVRELTVKAS